MYRTSRVVQCFLVIIMASEAVVAAWLPLSNHCSGGTFVPSSIPWLQQAQQQYHQSSSSSSSSSFPLYMGQRGKRIKKEKRRVLQDPTPPRIPTPYGPIRLNKPPRVCDTCSGRGMLRCPVCQGRGVIRKTGSRKTNPIQMDRLLGSRWTSVEIRHGHRQYRVAEIKGSTKRKVRDQVLLRMVNICTGGGLRPAVEFWIPMAELQDKLMWRMGWTTLQEIRQAQGGPLLDVRLCFRCKGGRIVSCLDCDGKGKIESLEPLYD